MFLLKAGGLAAALCCALLPPSTGLAATGVPTVQELLAAQDKDTQDELTAWARDTFAVPEDLVLDPPLREAAADMARSHMARLRALWPVWMAQERAASGKPALRGRALSSPLITRAINELALWTIESAGPAHDDAWLKAALAPMACAKLHPSHFARRLAMMQAAPLDARPALLAGERELLSRWGTQRAGLQPRPPQADLDAADQAITRLRAGLPVSAQPMTPNLAGQVFDRDRKPGPPDRWDQCARSQWWLGSQLAAGKVDRIAALTLYRYATMLDVQDFVPTSLLRKATSARPADGPAAYPPGALYFRVEGTTTVEADRDAEGKLHKFRVVARKITVPGVRDNPPVAFETLFDLAALDQARQRHDPTNRAQSPRIELIWRLSEGDDETR